MYHISLTRAGSLRSRSTINRVPLSLFARERQTGPKNKQGNSQFRLEIFYRFVPDFI